MEIFFKDNDRLGTSSIDVFLGDAKRGTILYVPSLHGWLYYPDSAQDNPGPLFKNPDKVKEYLIHELCK